jgi:DNA polymerase III epsilon subunit-like protein
MIVCIFDTETTGLIDNHVKRLDRQPEVIEFACVWADWDGLVSDEAVLDRYEVLIRPQLCRLNDKPEKEKPHHLTDEQLADCPCFGREIADKLVYFLAGSDVVCGHNLSFDMEMIDIEFERLGRKLVWPPVRMCTVEQTSHIAQDAQRKPSRYNRVSLGDLHYYLTGVEHENAHRAMDDVMATLRCLREIRRKGWL